MSLWTEKFENHAFQGKWDQIKSAIVAAKVDDATIATSVTELGRFKKVISYIDGLLKGIDPELVPLATWDNFDGQAATCLAQIISFNANKNISHIVEANKNADNLLTYVRPYMVAAGKFTKALRDSTAEYTRNLDDSAVSFQEKLRRILAEASEVKQSVSNLSSEAEKEKEKLDSVVVDVLGDGGSGGSYAKYKENLANFEGKYEEISDFHEKVLVDTDGEESIKSKISDAASSAEGEAKAVRDHAQRSKVVIDELNSFYGKVFGLQDSEGKKVGGLDEELKIQKRRLDDFEENQKTRCEALNKKIESLLPGATSAGLASAYHDMKDSFAAPIESANKIFYISIVLLVLVSFVLGIESVSLWPFNLTFVHVTDWKSVIPSLAYKLPVYGPVLWLAYTASKRRSEFQRLQQEYAHKEALAKSYDSFKKQIEALGSEDAELMKSLLDKSIAAIAYNASKTLDGKHGDKMPLQEVVEKAVAAVTKTKVNMPAG